MFEKKQNKDTTAYTDEELVKQIVRNKDSYYFSILYDRYARFVYNKCYAFVNLEEEAQDLTHDIFIKIFVSLGSFKGDSKLSTWIFSVTYHFCINYIKQKKSGKIISSEELLAGIGNNEELDDEQAEKELFEIQYTQLMEIMKQLAVEDRMILLMKYQDDLSIGEIMKVLNLGDSAVKMRLLRAKKKVLELRGR